MSIESTKATAPISNIKASQELRSRAAPQDNPQQAAPHNGEDKSDVTLSALTKKIQNDESRDVNYARIAELRAALEAGELPLEPEKIAQAMVQEIFQSH